MFKKFLLKYKVFLDTIDLLSDLKYLKMKVQVLFPKIEVREKGFLKVSDIHTIYWERSGNRNGKKY